MHSRLFSYKVGLLFAFKNTDICTVFVELTCLKVDFLMMMMMMFANLLYQPGAGRSN